MTQVYRFIEYRRALWFPGDGILEDRVRDALTSSPASTDRIVVRADGSSIMGNIMTDLPGEGIAFQCGRYVEGQPTGVLPMVGDTSVNVQERSPGNAENYVDTSYFGLVRGNHLLSISAGQNAAAVRVFLDGWLKNAGSLADGEAFDFGRVAQVAAVHKINSSGGVARVQMDLTMERASALYVESLHSGHGPGGLLGAAYNAACAIVGSNEQTEDLYNSNKGKLRLSVNVPSTDNLSAKESLTQVAMVLLEEDDVDTYVLELRNGDTIKPSEMSVRKKVRLSRFANGLDAHEAFTELRLYMNELAETGQLEA